MLLNRLAIAIDQDPLGKPGGILAGQQSATPQQIWWRPLSDGAVAVGLYNRGSHFDPPPIPSGPCPSWVHNASGYYEATGGAHGDLDSFSGLSVAAAQERCCANKLCAGFSYRPSDGSGYLKRDATAGFVPASGYEGYLRPSQLPPPSGSSHPANISVQFSDIGLAGKKVKVVDVWSGRTLGSFEHEYTAVGVAGHDTSFLRLTPL